MNSTNKKIWIDLDNSPHVPFFIPIIKELEKEGHSVFVTSRNCFQVCSLAEYFGLKHKSVGKHYGANIAMKVIGTVWRSLELAHAVRKEKPDLSLSHGSRALILTSLLMGIPTILLFDYEYAKMLPLIRPELGIAPEPIDGTELGVAFRHGVRKYAGLKEDVYVASFIPDSLLLGNLGLGEQDFVVTIRPPATEAHYHNSESEKLFKEVVDFIGSVPDVRMVILPRNEKTEREFIYNKWRKWCDERKIIIPEHAVNGLNLIWYSDLVVSGGGTMNREAAALGVPVYSIFRGKIGAVDKYLSETGRLTLIESVEDVRSKLNPVRRIKQKENYFGCRVALKQIVAAIEEVIERM